MRPLTEGETRLVLDKLWKYLGDNTMNLLDREDDLYLFRLHKDRVFYIRDQLVKAAGCIPRKKFIAAGTCIGKITKGKRFMLSITALEVLSKFAVYRIWVKGPGEQAFIFGNNVVKNHVGKVSEGITRNSGVIVYSMNDLPLGFGMSARSTEEMRDAPLEALVLYNQADVGEYLRHEADLV